MSKSELKLEDIFFPVLFQPIYLKSASGILGSESGQQTMFPEDEYQKVERYKAVVDCERNYLFKVVSDSYEIVRNKEAYEIGKRAYARLFPRIENVSDQFEVFKVTAPETRSYCHIDLVHKAVDINSGEQGQGDVYKPYLRITNSYNSTHALKFRIGFVRWACRNGVIFDKKIVDVNLAHTKERLKANDLAEVVELEANVEQLRTMEERFAEYLGQLNQYKIPKLYASPVVSKALHINFNVNAEEDRKKVKEREKAKVFDQTIQELVDKYYSKMGPHAYALFNVITDYATHAEQVNKQLRVHTYQRRAGEWIKSFCKRYRDRHFGLDEYVGDELTMFQEVR